MKTCCFFPTADLGYGDGGYIAAKAIMRKCLYKLMSAYHNTNSIEFQPNKISLVEMKLNGPTDFLISEVITGPRKK